MNSCGVSGNYISIYWYLLRHMYFTSFFYIRFLLVSIIAPDTFWRTSASSFRRQNVDSSTMLNFLSHLCWRRTSVTSQPGKVSGIKYLCFPKFLLFLFTFYQIIVSVVVIWFVIWFCLFSVTALLLIPFLFTFSRQLGVKLSVFVEK